MHTKLIKAPMRRSRRRYTEEFKKQAIAACLQPGISMASVALAVSVQPPHIDLISV